MGRILGGAPAWVYILLVVLIVLGARRLRTRQVPIAVALIPAIAFTVWSIVGAAAYAALAGAPVAAMVWIGGALAGWLSAIAVPEPSGERLRDGRVLLPRSVIPLATYLTVFVVRFGCGAWAAIHPAEAVVATGIGIAVGAATTARLVVAILRWRGPAVAAG